MTHKRESALQLLGEQKLLPLYYHDDAGVSTALLQALYEGGIRMVEYTARGAHAFSNFPHLKKASERLPGMLVGIGTVKTTAQATAFIDAGADFVVCPIMHAGIAEAVHAAGLLWIPGCLTPTEIAAAEVCGAAVVKIFPGNLPGPGYISAIRELFPALRFMPTGGVEAEPKNLRSWFGTGVVAVGMGSKLFSSQKIAQRDYGGITAGVRETLRLVKEAATVS